MKNSNKILYSVSGNIAILTINRPERRNALDAETLEQINILLDRAESCLLYTSDAADDMQCVDLGGRRII